MSAISADEMKKAYAKANENNYVIKEIKDTEPVIAYGSMVFLDLEELHQWKIKNLWNGIDIAVTKDDIRR